MAKTLDKYYLPDGYQTNPPETNELEGEIYWDESRVKTSLAYQKAVYEWALRIIGKNSIRSVADVGCGFAVKLDWLHQSVPDIDYWGIDQSAAINMCLKHYRFGNWLSVDLESDPSVPGILFDLIIASDVVEHLSNPDLLLDYIRRIGKAGSFVLISTPDRSELRGDDTNFSPNPKHVREWSFDEFRCYLESRNFELLEHQKLPAFDLFHSTRFMSKAIRRWVLGKSIRYNQAVLAQI